MTDVKTYPVVLRMEGMFPADLGGYEGHRSRKSGDLGHIDGTRSHLNRRLIGSESWAAEVQAEIADMAQENFAVELEKLKSRRRKTEVLKRIAEGPRAPWRKTRHGPLREIILTANREWFETFDFGSIDDLFGESREERFEALAVSWLREQFGEDVVHARADLDEAAYHIHAVIVPRAQTKDGRRMLQPSKHEMIRDYEKAQDSVGEWFAELGLTRGERRAAAVRKAREHNTCLRDDDARIPVPENRNHVSPRDWRRKQERKLADQEKNATKREQDVEALLDIAEAVARGDTDFLDKTSAEAPSPRATLAARVFGKAMAVLWASARQEAREELRRDYNEIRKADDAIVDAAKVLPRQARRAIIEARASLSKRILGLKNRIAGRDRAGGQQSPRDGDEKS